MAQPDEQLAGVSSGSSTSPPQWQVEARLRITDECPILVTATRGERTHNATFFACHGSMVRRSVEVWASGLKIDTRAAAAALVGLDARTNGGFAELLAHFDSLQQRGVTTH